MGYCGSCCGRYIAWGGEDNDSCSESFAVNVLDGHDNCEEFSPEVFAAFATGIANAEKESLKSFLFM
jgi:hypothetical protein